VSKLYRIANITLCILVVFKAIPLSSKLSIVQQQIFYWAQVTQMTMGF